MTRYFTAAQLLDMRLPVLPADKGAFGRMIDREGWKTSPLARQVDGQWEYSSALLPIEAQMEVLVRDAAAAESARSSSAAWETFERLAPGTQERAEQRLAVVTRVTDLTDAGSIKGAAVALASRQHGVATSTIWTWLKLIDGVPRPDWLPALAPGHRGRTATVECDPRAWDYFVADYLRASQPSLTSCYERLVSQAAPAHGWTPIPSLKTLQRRLDREVPAAAQALARKGRDVAARMFPAQRRDRSGFAALEAVNADGHKFDVFVRWEDGTVGRPVMVGVQDLATGMILGYRLDQTENRNAVRLAFADVVERHGIPRLAYLDNGRGFASKWLTGGAPTRYRFKVRDDEPDGILTTLGVVVHWTTPYHGQSKPIERAWRDLGEHIAKHPRCDGAYTGNNPTAKPENYGSRAVPIDEFRALVATEIERHNQRKGRRGMSVVNGESFAEALARKLKEPGAIVLKATAAQRRMLLLAAEGVTARKPSGEIHLMGNRYWAEPLADEIGHQLVVRFDPDNLHAGVAVYSRDGRFICDAPTIENSGFDDAADAIRVSRDRRRFVKGHRELLELERRFTPQQVAEMLPSLPVAPAPEAPVVRLMPEPTIPTVDPAAADAAFARAVRAMAGEEDEADVIPFRRAEG